MGKKDTTKMKKTNMLFVIKNTIRTFLVFWKTTGVSIKMLSVPTSPTLSFAFLFKLYFKFYVNEKETHFFQQKKNSYNIQGIYQVINCYSVKKIAIWNFFYHLGNNKKNPDSKSSVSFLLS